ncbi:MAG: PHP domain-containing protein [Eubacterium sp.]|nr:PHP domain-containing protein [Eubacterium sp.]
MRLIRDLHTHTTYSHGKNTIAEMVDQARALGLEAIVISDHGRSHPMFGVKPENFVKMRREIDALNEKYDDIQIYLAVEANIIDSQGQIDIGAEERKYCDWIYAGYHYGFTPPNFKEALHFALRGYLARVLPFMRRRTKAIYTQAYLKMMDRYSLKMITHPGDKLPVDIDAVAKKAAERGVILEINPRHAHLSAEELKIAMQYGGRFAVNSDAHSTEALGQVEAAWPIIEEAGLPLSRVVNVR